MCVCVWNINKRSLESVGHLSGDFSDAISLQYYYIKELCQEIHNLASMLEHISMN